VNLRWKTLNNVSLPGTAFGGNLLVRMNRHCGDSGCKSQEAFQLRFRRHLRVLLCVKHCSAAEGFGPAWELTLREVPLQDEDQAPVFWQLVGWAKALGYSQRRHEL
jgi:hypothetical protein